MNLHEQEKVFDGWAQEMIDLLVQANQEVQLHGAPLAQDRQLWYDSQWNGLLARAVSFNPQNQDHLQHAPKPGRRKQSLSYGLLMGC